MPFDPSLAAIFEYRVRGQFGSIIADDHFRLAVHCNQDFKFARDPLARDRGVGDRRQTFARHIIDHAEHPEPAASTCWS
jgi:hypothetical protein